MSIAFDVAQVMKHIRLVFILGAALHDNFKNTPFGKNQPTANTQNDLMHCFKANDLIGERCGMTMYGPI